MSSFRIVLGMLAVGAVLAACAPIGSHQIIANLQAQSEAQKTKNVGAFQSYVGNDYWVTRKDRLVVCPDKDHGQDCRLAWGRFTIDQIYDPHYEMVVLHVSFHPGAVGFATTDLNRMANNFRTREPPFEANIQPSFLDYLPKKVGEARRRIPGVLIGMSEAEVLESDWGKPEHTKEIVKGRRVRVGWYYPHGNALFFEDGSLYAIEK